MKKISIFILLIVTFFVFLSMGKSVNAQTNQDLLIVSSYLNDQQMDEIFKNTQRVLVYTEGGDKIPAKILSLASTNQKEILDKKGIESQIIAQNPDLDRYVLLYNPKENQSTVLEEYGKPIIISQYYTLLELPKGKELVYEGPISKFFKIPFLDEVKRPPIVTVVEPRVQPSITGVQESTKKTPGLATFIIIGFVILLIVGGVIAYYFYKKRKTEQVQTF